MKSEINPEVKKILIRAIETYGSRCQVVKAMEEMDELGKELCKVVLLPAGQPVPRELYDHVAEEMADVMLMMAQMSFIFKNSKLVNKHMWAKLKRLEGRIDEKVKSSA